MTVKSMTPVEAARALGVTRPYVYELLAEGRLPGVWKVGRSWRIPTEIVRALKKARQARRHEALLLSGWKDDSGRPSEREMAHAIV